MAYSSSCEEYAKTFDFPFVLILINLEFEAEGRMSEAMNQRRTL